MLCSVVRHVALESVVVDAVVVLDCGMLVLDAVLDSVVVGSVGSYHHSADWPRGAPPRRGGCRRGA